MCKNESNDPRVAELLEKISHQQILKSSARGDDRINITKKIDQLKFELKQTKSRITKTPVIAVKCPAFGPSRI